MGSLIQNTVWGRLKAPRPNTFIGGIGATIKTPALLAAKLKINVALIRSFSIIDNNIECAMMAQYNPYPFIDDTALTYYEDRDGLVKNFSATHYNFRGCSNLLYVIMPKLEFVGPSAFGNCVKLEFIELPNLVTIDSLGTNDAITVFQNCNKLTKLQFPNLINFRANSALSGLIAIALVDIPKCRVLGKSLSNNSVFNAIKMGCVVNVHQTMATINAGSPDGDLQYLISSRGGVVNYMT